MIVVTSGHPGGRAAAALARRADHPRDGRRRAQPRTGRHVDREPDGHEHLLNAALLRGAAVAARRWPGTGIAALTADLPALRPAELDAALRAASDAAPCGASDAALRGTGAYSCRTPPGSARHFYTDHTGRSSGRCTAARPGRGAPRRRRRTRARRASPDCGGGHAGGPAGGGSAWGRTADRRGRCGAPRRRVSAQAGERAWRSLRSIRTTGQVRVLVIPSTA